MRNSNENEVTLKGRAIKPRGSLPQSVNLDRSKPEVFQVKEIWQKIIKIDRKVIGGKNTNTENYPVQWDISSQNQSHKICVLAFLQLSKAVPQADPRWTGQGTITFLRRIGTVSWHLGKSSRAELSFATMCRCLSFIINMVHVFRL